MVWLSTSPNWLLLYYTGKDNMQDLREITLCCLCQLRGQSTGESALEQEDEILTEFFYASEEKEAIREEMFHGNCLTALIIGAGLALFQQITDQPNVLYCAAGIPTAIHATQVYFLIY